MDPDLELVWSLFKHLFPEFNCNHVCVYKYLWKIQAKSGEEIAIETKISKATVYKILRQLMMAGLVEKTNFKPVGFFAINPLGAYNVHLKKLFGKLEKGREQLEKLIKNSTGLSGELYLVKLDGGQQKIFAKQNRQTISDEFELKEYKKIIENQLVEAERKKMKQWQLSFR